MELDIDEVKISFLDPNGPSRSFKYPSMPDIMTVSCQDVLTKVYPTTAKGRVYKITSKESKEASETLSKHLNLQST